MLQFDDHVGHLHAIFGVPGLSPAPLLPIQLPANMHPGG